MEEINKKEDFDTKLRFLIGYQKVQRDYRISLKNLIEIWCRGRTYPVSKIGQSGLQNQIL
jgi:hypothetical protein